MDSSAASLQIAAPRPLKQSMRVMGVLLLTLSSVTPASSVFVIVPGVIAQAGTGAFLSLLAGAAVGVAMAFVYAELSSAFPLTGGEYAILGRTLMPLTGFMILGLNGFGGMLSVAALAVGASEYLGAVIPGASPVPVGIAITVLATLLCVLNVRTNAWITGAFLLLEVVALAVLAALGFGHIVRPISELFLHPVLLNGGTLSPVSIAAIGLATSVSTFAYNGFGAAVYFGEEMHEAPRLIGRTILWALAVTVGLELIPVTAVLLSAPNLKSFLGSQNPFVDFVLGTGGPLLNKAIGLGVALAIVNAVIATVLMNARFFYSTGRDGVWTKGINRALTITHPRFHSPWVATLLAGITAAAACFIPLEQLLTLNAAGIVIMYLLLCLGTIAGRRTGTTSHGYYRMPLHPAAVVFGLVALTYILYANWLDPGDGRTSVIVSAAAMVLSAAYYFVVLKRRGDWILRGPGDVLD
jgi:amino acid transporter